MNKSISKLTLKSGDILVVSLPRMMTEKGRADFKKQLPADVVVIFKTNDTGLSVLSPKQPENGWKLIQRERLRQMSVEGFTHAHDDAHEDCELRKAADCYALPPAMRVYRSPDAPPNGWPWERQWWKPVPDNRIRELIKAGALYLAERDRCRRFSRHFTARMMEKKARRCGKQIDRILRDLRNWNMLPGPTAPMQKGVR